MSLTRRSELRSYTPLPRSGMKPRKRPIARVSARRKAARPERDRVWEQVQARDRYCLLQLHEGIAGRCHGHLTPHHLQKGGQGGPFTPTNIVVLCAHHNGWVEDHPPIAHRIGLVVRHGETVGLAWQRMRDTGLVRRGPA